ncbi:distal tail protein Dit [Lactiplantibacillus paraxiangfangensis]|uniref:distal tail protein Dit n=1 Tax=Lactiplantibacillus paraxiangfangensis TaxID=3076224 RepID=UPI0030C73147
MTLEYDDFEYAGLNSRETLQVEMGNVILPSAPAMAEQTTDIPAKYGTQFLGTDYTGRTINIPVTVYCADNQRLFNQVMHNLAGLLLSDDPDKNGEEYPLVFGFEPDVTYWGHITAISDPAPINTGMFDATLTITFVQSDPRATKPQVETPLKEGLNTITVGGTARTEPVIQAVAKRDLKYIGFSLNGGIFGLGPETDEDQADAVQPDVRVVDDPIATMAMWTNDSTAVSGMQTSGSNVYQGSCEISSKSTAMMVKDFGKMPTKLGDTSYGPAYRYTGLTNALTDWRVRAGLHHIKYSGTHNGRAMGRCEILLLDANGDTILRFGFVDISKGARPLLRLQLCEPGSKLAKGDGTHHNLYHDYGPTGSFNHPTPQKFKVKTGTKTKTVVKKSKNKKGKVVKKTIKEKKKQYVNVVNKEEKSALTSAWIVLDITKKGNVFTWSLTQYNTKTGQPYKDAVHHLVVKGKYVDTAGKYTTALGGVGAVFLKRPITEDISKIKYKDPYMTVTGIQIWQHTEPAASQPTFIANAGEEIVMDCETDSTTVNGRLVSPVWSTDYPKLRPGVNNLTMVGDLSDAQITLKYLPRIL